MKLILSLLCGIIISFQSHASDVLGDDIDEKSVLKFDVANALSDFKKEIEARNPEIGKLRNQVIEIENEWETLDDMKTDPSDMVDNQLTYKKIYRRKKRLYAKKKKLEKRIGEIVGESIFESSDILGFLQKRFPGKTRRDLLEILNDLGMD